MTADAVILMKGAVSFKDIVKGKIEIDTGILSDFVLFKSDGMPTYNFACAVDDSNLEITHIIRGDDHVSNTHKQILLYRALDKEIPEFAHLPQVHGTDGKRLSKRTGAVSLDEYREKGYLPDALRNYLY
jgi:glutamyl/glutaminyl-tRNA synthetase